MLVTELKVKFKFKPLILNIHEENLASLKIFPQFLIIFGAQVSELFLVIIKKG
jgi:hypothetical protein